MGARYTIYVQDIYRRACFPKLHILYNLTIDYLVTATSVVAHFSLTYPNPSPSQDLRDVDV